MRFKDHLYLDKSYKLSSLRSISPWRWLWKPMMVWQIHKNMPKTCVVTLSWLSKMVMLWARSFLRPFRVSISLVELGSVMGFNDPYTKLVSWLNTNIPTNRSFTKLFYITQPREESNRAYLKRFNEEMLKEVPIGWFVINSSL